MESDAFVSVCDGTQVFIVDLKNGNQVMKRPMSAEAAIMNPVSKILALRAGQQLQIFNLELRAKMKSHQMPEAVVFWRWVSPSTIALVTPTAVFHWSTEGSSAPTKVFDRHAQLGEGTQVINYQVSPDEKWCMVWGICQGGAACSPRVSFPGSTAGLRPREAEVLTTVSCPSFASMPRPRCCSLLRRRFVCLHERPF